MLTDSPESILARIAFYDDESRRIEKVLTEREKRHYRLEIKRDMAYFGRGYRKADLTVDLAGLDPGGGAARIVEALRLADVGAERAPSQTRDG